MKRIIHTLAILLIGLTCFSQVPQNFAYQAVVRNAQGQVLANQDAEIRISLIEGTIGGSASYSEMHLVTTSPQGIVNLIVGEGTAKFKSINTVTWNQPTFIKLEIKLSGEPSFVDMGTSQLLSVPYALKAGSLAKNPIEVLAPADQNPDEPIFVVKNSGGEVVFAVYETGTRVYVDKSSAKGSRGGFAIGGIGDNNKEGVVPHYLAIEPDSVRFNITQNAKNTRGGFAIGGIGDNIKEQLGDYLYIRPDSIRFAVDESLTEKGSRGGFAIGGIGDNNKAFNNYFYVNQDCTYVSNTLNASGNVVVAGNMLMGGTIGTLPVTDGENNTYATVSLGGNVWMAKNLKATKYRDGADITSTELEGGPAYFQVEDQSMPQEIDFWGYLYALKVIDPERICPDGWRLPTAQDWNDLIMATNVMGNVITLVDDPNGIWTSGVKGAKVQGGFNARPAGSLFFENLPPPFFSGFSNIASFWSMPDVDSQSGNLTSQIFNIIKYSDDNFGVQNYPEEVVPGTGPYNGFSIRCVKGISPTSTK
jgi:uncharacterized protein (TIGR02145 family)